MYGDGVCGDGYVCVEMCMCVWRCVEMGVYSISNPTRRCNSLYN